ncbi:hypothetical protein [Enterovirga aerilata]|uniref:MobC family plasmid mobilization relaxosome protein n=1 Tax=Enterovirga aerilata TaxID=2730920 RepID=A0A849ICI3_9HYPH|nr:hypothetical protein [Enterovirga sp. DB1703]NNM73955.1 hypothetical protein [Enterovirga sp. DB1703]
MSAEESFNVADSVLKDVGLVRETTGDAASQLPVTEDERVQLGREANGAPLASYGEAAGRFAPRIRRPGLPIEDRQALALLSNSRLVSNLNQLARLAHIGALPVSDEIGAEFHEAAGDIRTIRDCLLRALGLSTSL